VDGKALELSCFRYVGLADKLPEPVFMNSCFRFRRKSDVTHRAQPVD